MKLFALLHGRQSKEEENEIIPTQPGSTPPSAFQELTDEDLKQAVGGNGRVSYYEVELEKVVLSQY